MKDRFKSKRITHVTSAIRTTMTESSFSCWLSSEIKEFRVSVKYEWTSLLTLGIPMTIDTVKKHNKVDVKLSC